MVFIWGIELFFVDWVKYIDVMYKQVDQKLMELGFVEVGDKVVVILGFFFGVFGFINDLCVYIVGSVFDSVVLVWESGEYVD